MDISPIQQPANVFSSMCSSRGALQHVTGRWGSLTMVALKRSDEPMRFAEIRRKVEGISDRMLSQTLAQLERDGMVDRTVHSSIPPHVDYTLTPLGTKLADALVLLVSTVEAELDQVVRAQEIYDKQH
ncbi:transcriptional repressor of quinone oxidoreductase qor2 [Corynebacterium glutamicum MB001]|uniref:Predicted transcriptional regulators n=2 Tax=Corynebacterium TaxID=1716 RepID=Q8NQQ5_CORGL|nr:MULTISPECIES: helix-turn-helix domain-containing protein [Corynebacterium]AGT05339.1 transcriptional repressor of quinone oxidoreductase qor2 [Corynebacterium glutamicum MB001]AIK85051.1 transcriptional regulator [Corynebacterium glutamicum]AIK87835.1 transcriptional regulator [Corynebacterium glutamicum]AJE67322.1 transcriptional regulator [Corynebacterium glutamicum]AKF27360.1 transcriptional regulator [[Brevibacterium] flavum]